MARSSRLIVTFLSALDSKCVYEFRGVRVSPKTIAQAVLRSTEFSCGPVNYKMAVTTKEFGASIVFRRAFFSAGSIDEKDSEFYFYIRSFFCKNSGGAQFLSRLDLYKKKSPVLGCPSSFPRNDHIDNIFADVSLEQIRHFRFGWEVSLMCRK